jgi:hypothetical protein
MSETIPNLLQTISTTSGFAVFCMVIATAYAGVWYLFLYEPPPKRKKTPESEKYEEDEEAPRRERSREKPAQKQAA